MRKTLLLLLSAFTLLFVADSAKAQSYTTAAGLKFGGYENGISVKHFTNENTALEGVLGFRRGGLVITGLYEIHQTAFNTDALKFYYGFGAHAGSVSAGKYKKLGGDEVFEDSKILIGADGVLGLEYVIPNSPIGISLDLNPRVELAGPFFDLAPGLGIKYTF
ncbi:hypothetical protein IM792_10065 [Mucilaginibacter sp. JRF]|uniref:hypothetical protein n=1 Tax=Mucilaginibacter sp. JRF TaxID=2780088 RepID=UPI0018802D3A|nr:hypothetical protein [Mucilaginibacter sp. JRF]MBE9584791.1 hypothetical protein [Mucilaginibacter sp. JRF]